MLSRRVRVTCGEHSLGISHLRGEEKAGQGCANRAQWYPRSGIERRTVRKAYPHRPRAGLQRKPPGSRARPRKERGIQEGGIACDLFLPFPRDGYPCSQEPVQGLSPQDSPQRPPNSHVAPSSQAPGPSGPAQLPGSSAEARQLPSWAPAPHS